MYQLTINVENILYCKKNHDEYLEFDSYKLDKL